MSRTHTRILLSLSDTENCRLIDITINKMDKKKTDIHLLDNKSTAINRQDKR